MGYGITIRCSSCYEDDGVRHVIINNTVSFYPKSEENHAL